jgi:trk system potassium uptake protein TrkH
MNFRMIKQTLGYLLIFEAAFLLVPIITAAVYAEKSALLAFLATLGLCLVCGIALISIFKPKNKQLFARDGFLIASSSWLLMGLFGALPFVISGAIPNYIDALFEIVSGFTTTGASILSEVESLPKSMLMWRSFSHWVGGMGVLVFIIAFLPLSGGQNMHIMKAESPGPSVSKLVPRVKDTAVILYAIYIALTLGEFILLLI